MRDSSEMIILPVFDKCSWIKSKLSLRLVYFTYRLFNKTKCFKWQILVVCCVSKFILRSVKFHDYTFRNRSLSWLILYIFSRVFNSSRRSCSHRGWCLCLSGNGSIHQCLLIAKNYWSILLRFIYFLWSGIVELRNRACLRIEVAICCWIIVLYLYMWKIRLRSLVIEYFCLKSSYLIYFLRYDSVCIYISKWILKLILLTNWIGLINLIRNSILIRNLSICGMWDLICGSWRSIYLLILSILINLDRRLWCIVIF